MQQVEQRRMSQIRLWIEERLSTENDLVPGAFPMTEQLVNRHGALCGTLYCLHGPRSVRLVAVHDSTTDRIITYDANGVRRGDYLASEVLVESYGASPELAAPPRMTAPVFN